MNKKQIKQACENSNICGALKKFNLWERITLFPDNEHFCGEEKGHEGNHHCFYTECKKEWKDKK
jgi:hypothetical protein